jgi:zinc D-Ala-D-Ala carboxypeptidase
LEQVSIWFILDAYNDSNKYVNWQYTMKYFKLSEFDSPDLVGSGEAMDREFLTRIDQARSIAGVPFKITSGVRSKAWNKKVGGVENSSHITGHAADIACTNSVYRFKIITSLLKAGLNRIGIADNFIHVDNDPEKAPNVIWTY